MGEQYLLEMKGISKSFPGVKALSNVELQLRAGEVHALLGENGAGKSTLIKVLGGIYHAEEGEILIGGQKVNIDGVVSARNAGVSIVHQELINRLSIITEEEQEILSGRLEIDRTRYTEQSQLIIDSKKMLDHGKLIQIRPHTRFVHFPKHRHNYVEVVYMCQGQTTHLIDGTQILLKKAAG